MFFEQSSVAIFVNYLDGLIHLSPMHSVTKLIPKLALYLIFSFRSNSKEQLKVQNYEKQITKSGSSNVSCSHFSNPTYFGNMNLSNNPWQYHTCADQ